MSSPALPLFRSLRLLRGLNVLGVGCALGALTGVCFGHVFGTSYFSEPAAITTALTTLAVGAGWAALLRWRQTVRLGRWEPRVGWLLSAPLAVLNSALASSILFGHFRAGGSLIVGFLGSVILSATFGVLFWAPALTATLLCFGIPIRWAQRLASRGLAGEERGERVVGLVVVALSLLALAGGATRYPSSERHSLEHMDFAPEELETGPTFGPSVRPPDSPATALLAALALTGVLAGGSSALLAAGRERRRRRFVAEAEAGRAPGFRVTTTEEGKVLVRVAGESGYRDDQGADEELFALDERGLATHAVPGPHQE